MTGPPPPEEITDLGIIKALSHPLRRRILEQLQQGPESSTTLAAKLGENTGATSYHLRELAKHGFIDEAPELASGKQRWWRTKPRDLRFPRRSEQSPEMRAAFDDLNDHRLGEDFDLWTRFRAKGEELGEWADAVPFARGSLRLTPEELMRFFDDYMALYKKYWRAQEDAPPDARAVVMRFLAFRHPDVPD
jgi:DNA-binding transcriptional ArsR family regulator